jgi:hypothetical protein
VNKSIGVYDITFADWIFMGDPDWAKFFFLDTIEDKVKRVKGKAKSVCCSQKVFFAWKFLHQGIMPGSERFAPGRAICFPGHSKGRFYGSIAGEFRPPGERCC